MHDQDQDHIYQRVANYFAAVVSNLFSSEDMLKAQFKELFPGLEFSRTNHWGSIIYLLLRDCWMTAGPEVKGEPTGYDRNVVLTKLHGHRLLDYNLFTQVLVNLQSYVGMEYRARDAEDDLKKLEEEWKEQKRNPFAPGAKMIKNPVQPDEWGYNIALSTIKSLKIIASFTPQLSFRVSPKGSTPVLVDSNNISNLGVGSDRYLRVMPSLRAWYIHWVPGSGPRMAEWEAEVGVLNSTTGMFRADGIPYPFQSKSGGEVLNQVLFSRKVAFNIFPEYDIKEQTCIIVPRMSSVLVVADEQGLGVKAAFYRMRSEWPMLELSEGTRQADGGQ
jgi:hypothetical protein